jgi:hypothetical protein
MGRPHNAGGQQWQEAGSDSAAGAVRQAGQAAGSVTADVFSERRGSSPKYVVEECRRRQATVGLRQCSVGRPFRTPSRLMRRAITVATGYGALASSGRPVRGGAGERRVTLRAGRATGEHLFHRREAVRSGVTRPASAGSDWLLREPEQLRSDRPSPAVR